MADDLPEDIDAALKRALDAGSRKHYGTPSSGKDWDALQKWALETQVRKGMLEMICDGSIIVAIDSKGEPYLMLT